MTNADSSKQARPCKRTGPDKRMLLAGALFGVNVVPVPKGLALAAFVAVRKVFDPR